MLLLVTIKVISDINFSKLGLLTLLKLSISETNYVIFYVSISSVSHDGKYYK